MSGAHRTAVIVNPKSAGGRTGRVWTSLAKRIEARLGLLTIRFTERGGHATALARELLTAGYDRIIAVGGDGTVNEVANGFVLDGRPIRPDAAMALLPLGTGSDFQRTLGIPSAPEAAIDYLVTGVPVEIDLGRITFRAYDGSTVTRCFANLTSFGMGGEVASRAKNSFAVFGGKAAFLWATLVTFFKYRAKSVRIRLDDAPEQHAFSILNIAVGNGRFHGGGMHVCPRASISDGLLEVTVIDDLGMFTLVRDLHVLYSDDLYRHPKTRHFRARKLIAESDDITRIEVDGEALGTLPLEITVLPKAMRVLAPQP